jgi:nitrogen fixation/metabolism regulation signal transduction histidine kinase
VSPSNPRTPRLAFETRLALLTLAAGFPAVIATLGLLWYSGYQPRISWTIGLPVVGLWLAFSFAARERIVRPLQTLSNLIAALQEGDYTIRARGGRPDDALDNVFREVNTLTAVLQEQRLSSLEATALLRAVMTEIDVAVFTFDDNEHELRLVNRAGEDLLKLPAAKLLGRHAAELGLDEYLNGESTRVINRAFPAGSGRWGVRVTSFREGGLPHRLLVIEDLTRALREEELQAWKRLVRVLGHELNNSLTPIRSIAESLSRLVTREPLPSDWRDDATRGLGVISGRAESLTRFLDSYARLAKLPPPVLGVVDVSVWVRRAAGLETRLKVGVIDGPAFSFRGDGDQLDQLLINLIRNAADAAIETGGGVAIEWGMDGAQLILKVRDEGHGIANPGNLFVPFFTTKKGGSGIGLVLCRQIAEGHRGTLDLRNREDRIGGEAILRIPVEA